MKAILKLIIAGIDDEIKIIEADERFDYPPAQVDINAPLALIQVDLKARHNTLTSLKDRLEKVLSKSERNGEEPRPVTLTERINDLEMEATACLIVVKTSSFSQLKEYDKEYDFNYLMDTAQDIKRKIGELPPLIEEGEESTC